MMGNNITAKQKILIADDSEMNRALLVDMLESEFDIVEVENGNEAVSVLQNQGAEISLLLLDIVMPELDGFGVLELMNKYRWIEDTPVIMITSENSPTLVERAYDLGVTDFISRPYDAMVVRRRVSNTMLLAAKQRRLMSIVADQIYENEKSSKLMVAILSHIVEFRNGESGLHVLHIGAISEMLARRLVQKTNRYPLSSSEINLIKTASALHDIGKISISGEILNKPGRLTEEEFEIIKAHARIGADMLRELPQSHQDEPLVKMAYQICRWHHERYDGRGYPDGLRGDEIPISAQLVSLADVYDALTSERCYKRAYSHDRAMTMILEGQCGAFNPLLLDCLRDISDTLQQELKSSYIQMYSDQQDVQRISEQLHSYDLLSSENRFQQMEDERKQFQVLFNSAEIPIFRYSAVTAVLRLNKQAAKLFRVGDTLTDPMNNRALLSAIEKETFERLLRAVQAATSDYPSVNRDIRVKEGEGYHWYRCTCTTLWSGDAESHFASLVGRLVDVQDQYEKEGQAKEQQLQAVLPKSEDRQESVLSPQEAWAMRQQLLGVFDIVRLVDPTANREVIIDEDGGIHPKNNGCYCVWNRTSRCENCVSAKCVCTHTHIDKFEFVNDEIYYVMAHYLEVGGHPYAMEMVSRVTDETILCGHGREKLVESITEHNRKLYIDPVAGVYNRRYYEEQLAQMHQTNAVAMMDLDNFKSINDSYGHQVGDLALRQVAQAISSCVRKSDAVVRYGGDEFVVIFQDIPRGVFERKLEAIRHAVSNLAVPEIPGMRLEISVGGGYGIGSISELVRMADEKMYDSKRLKKEQEGGQSPV